MKIFFFTKTIAELKITPIFALAMTNGDCLHKI